LKWKILLCKTLKNLETVGYKRERGLRSIGTKKITITETRKKPKRKKTVSKSRCKRKKRGEGEKGKLNDEKGWEEGQWRPLSTTNGCPQLHCPATSASGMEATRSSANR